MGDDPFDFQELIKEENWTVTSAIHTPTFHGKLSEHARTLTLTFANQHEETLGRRDVEALTRYLKEYAHVAPLLSTPLPDAKDSDEGIYLESDIEAMLQSVCQEQGVDRNTLINAVFRAASRMFSDLGLKYAQTPDQSLNDEM